MKQLPVAWKQQLGKANINWWCSRSHKTLHLAIRDRVQSEWRSAPTNHPPVLRAEPVISDRHDSCIRRRCAKLVCLPAVGEPADQWSGEGGAHGWSVSDGPLAREGRGRDSGCPLPPHGSPRAALPHEALILDE